MTTTNDGSQMTASATPILDELARLRAVARDVQRMPWEIEQQKRALLAGVETARHELSSYYAQASGENAKTSDAAEAKLKAAVVQAQQALDSQQWADRISGAALAGRNAQQNVELFIQENVVGIAEEQTMIAEQNRAAVVVAIEALQAAVVTYSNAASGWGDITRHLPGGSALHRVPPTNRLGQAMHELAHVLDQGIELAVPASLMAGLDQVAA